MTLQEAIEHSYEVINKTDCLDQQARHIQLITWLKELQTYREQMYEIQEVLNLGIELAVSTRSLIDARENLKHWQYKNEMNIIQFGTKAKSLISKT